LDFKNKDVETVINIQVNIDKNVLREYLENLKQLLKHHIETKKNIEKQY
jgi:hypothetical protein